MHAGKARVLHWVLDRNTSANANSSCRNHRRHCSHCIILRAADHRYESNWRNSNYQDSNTSDNIIHSAGDCTYDARGTRTARESYVTIGFHSP